MLYEPVGYEKVDEGYYTVKLNRDSAQYYYVDVFIDEKNKDVNPIWNKFAFDLNSDAEMLRYTIQNDEDEAAYAMSSAVAYLEDQEVIYQDEECNWYERKGK